MNIYKLTLSRKDCYGSVWSGILAIIPLGMPVKLMAMVICCFCRLVGGCLHVHSVAVVVMWLCKVVNCNV